jgi:hypothetical protein
VAVNPAAGGAPIAPLACGRDAATVWDRAAAGLPPDEHERGCPHCAAAYADALGLDAVVHRMAAQDLQDLEPPSSVLDRVLTTLAERVHAHDVLTLASPHGPARLAHPAAAAVLRHVVDGMDGLRARSCRIEQPDGGAVDVTITVAARFGVELTSVTARVRQMVVAAGEQALGLPVRRVDIEVVDLLAEALLMETLPMEEP